MPGTTFLHALAVAALLALPACTPASPPTKDDPMSRAPAPADKFNLQPVKEWPLKFDSHSFGVYTYDTYGVEVIYAGRIQLQESDTELQRSSDSYGPDYRRAWGSGHIDIRNFPPPAEVKWRSKDGTPHQARIDIAEIFRDEVVRHNVKREEMPELMDGEYRSDPHIALEINDRTINVYMIALVPTKALQDPGNPYSNGRSDRILVKSYSY